MHYNTGCRHAAIGAGLCLGVKGFFLQDRYQRADSTLEEFWGEPQDGEAMVMAEYAKINLGHCSPYNVEKASACLEGSAI
jgi:hypothetical protein